MYTSVKRCLVCLAAICLSGVAPSCNKESAAPPAAGVDNHPVVLNVPANFTVPRMDADNPLTREGIALGRLLFYDKRLSGSNQLSCASCHRPELAFSDGIALTNIGESGKTLLRHTPALINLAWIQNGLFWDGGSTNLESQAFAPLASEDEMHQNLHELEAELGAVPDYVRQFGIVFGSADITAARVIKALAQFERTLISGSSRYDRYIRHETDASLSGQEQQGMALVNQRCKGCHNGELFTDNSYHNNGLDNDFSTDAHDGLFKGRARITFNSEDLGKYRTPTLRNVVLTAPYMHDGRFSTLDAVLDHYHSGIKTSPTTDRLLYQNNGQTGIPLTKQDKENIIAFLHTLSDESFTHNPNFNNP